MVEGAFMTAYSQLQAVGANQDNFRFHFSPAQKGIFEAKPKIHKSRGAMRDGGNGRQPSGVCVRLVLK
jgi:hypothetical protein